MPPVSGLIVHTRVDHFSKFAWVTGPLAAVAWSSWMSSSADHQPTASPRPKLVGAPMAFRSASTWRAAAEPSSAGGKLATTREPVSAWASCGLRGQESGQVCRRVPEGTLVAGLAQAPRSGRSRS